LEGKRIIGVGGSEDEEDTNVKYLEGRGVVRNSTQRDGGQTGNATRTTIMEMMMIPLSLVLGSMGQMGEFAAAFLDFPHHFAVPL
jgi:hypothetical protein